MKFIKILFLLFLPIVGFSQSVDSVFIARYDAVSESLSSAGAVYLGDDAFTDEQVESIVDIIELNPKTRAFYVSEKQSKRNDKIKKLTDRIGVIPGKGNNGNGRGKN